MATQETRVYVAQTANKGRGIFAARRFDARELIEVCPVIVLPQVQRASLDATVLYNYHFAWEDEGVAICLGYGSLYNHSYRPNAMYIKEFSENRIRFQTIEPIQKDEEITVNYTGYPNGTRALWFTPVQE